MPFADSFPMRACGPRTDVQFVYGRFTVSNSGATLTADANTTPGLTMTGDSGIYVLNHRKCRFRMFMMQVQLPTIATVADKREIVQHVPTASTDDATTGILNFNTQGEDGTSGINEVAEPVDNSVIEVFGVLGF